MALYEELWGQTRCSTWVLAMYHQAERFSGHRRHHLYIEMTMTVHISRGVLSSGKDIVTDILSISG
jgi:hypothetical protein